MIREVTDLSIICRKRAVLIDSCLRKGILDLVTHCRVPPLDESHRGYEAGGNLLEFCSDEEPEQNNSYFDDESLRQERKQLEELEAKQMILIAERMGKKEQMASIFLHVYLNAYLSRTT
jgi:hypothetical protein